MNYKDAGVNIDEGNKLVEMIKPIAKQTLNEYVLEGIGGFAGLIEIKNYKNPVLISSTDGVGTKLKIAFMMDKHDTVGIDLVAMCVNDIIVTGAKPLFFLDYFATGKLKSETAVEVIKGIAEGCKIAGCALIGGETAELPGFYKEGEYDLAGFCVGIAEKEELIDTKLIKEGDAIIGLASSGIHSNGYSLVRKIFFEKNNFSVKDFIPELGINLGEALLTPTKIYVKSIEALKGLKIKGMAHITGGGFIDNIPRILRKSIAAKINKGSWEIPAIFNLIQRLGDIEEREMYRTFNMGIGMIVIVDPSDVDKALEKLNGIGEKAYIIGEIVESEGGVIL
ncbi:phosphoribosylformylglycinamidine cyclo-ligase [Thermoanaerobacter mathranii subsp. mathranii str. A3]|jgi:phosphoribosylformylglycinamidine cyclo-ligase|uniref:Phosphoribosylformylglycinamidine cyclo-ligase n=2 Tax=Thermoanaerobacter TaxID=1754 RepID=A0ABT9M4N3_9THEO|nr:MULTISPECIES: phosphoribosylformylglycinamidine cyclo-ligase [Thermoanaerobacter]ADH60388.1 phosphoribosylformylglycinamidine cyclo-ligase [Thermoanaerobacter mathranii subsp. mathranii str. A3]MBT1279023.1 phosphoribosylformylglycinamidine cyclo-ligase [Thermoanaerobacter sp. CM-CNRG TB177]MDK2814979.1 phosphoribosylformylglycinamidine cyclo-ligase [Thermoanaerobacter sp.]MDP9751091.1 phosphoribosylformylglycinamidine cyclo-ligase [Thermoanaerobacter pentosaceus]